MNLLRYRCEEAQATRVSFLEMPANLTWADYVQEFVKVPALLESAMRLSGREHVFLSMVLPLPIAEIRPCHWTPGLNKVPPSSCRLNYSAENFPNL